MQQRPKWFDLPTENDCRKLHRDMEKHGYSVIEATKDLSCIRAGMAGRARRLNTMMIIEEALDELECIRTVYDTDPVAASALGR